VADAVERVTQMLRLVSDDLPQGNLNVFDYPEANAQMPFWWVTPGPVETGVRATAQRIETYDVSMRYIIGSVAGGVRGSFARGLWVVIPTVQEYFAARANLAYEPGQPGLNWLDPTRTRISVALPIGEQDGSNYIGIEFSLRLVFNRTTAPASVGRPIT
jgi:hypothetical protein